MCPVVSFLLLLVCSCWVSVCDSHGRLMDPPARNSMWRLGFDNPVNYNDHELYCGGRVTQWARNKGRCGVCGDPYHLDRPHEFGGKYANGIITRNYKQGDVINVVIHITANHQGYFEFRICPMTNPTREVTQECLDKHRLQVGPNLGLSQYRYSLDRGKSNQLLNYSLILPPGLSCDHCVLQWKYRTGNTWDRDPDGTYCLGCGPQEEFYNCADVSISSRHSRSSSIYSKQTGQNSQAKFAEGNPKFYSEDRNRNSYPIKSSQSHSRANDGDLDRNGMTDNGGNEITNFVKREKHYIEDIHKTNAVPYSLFRDRPGNNLILISTSKHKDESVKTFQENVDISEANLKHSKYYGNEEGNAYFDDKYDVKGIIKRNDGLLQWKHTNPPFFHLSKTSRKLQNQKHGSYTPSFGVPALKDSPSEKEILDDYIFFNNANVSSPSSLNLPPDKKLFSRNYNPSKSFHYETRASPDTDRNHFGVEYSQTLTDADEFPPEYHGQQRRNQLSSKLFEDRNTLSPKTLLQWVVKAIESHDSVAPLKKKYLFNTKTQISEKVNNFDADSDKRKYSPQPIDNNERYSSKPSTSKDIYKEKLIHAVVKFLVESKVLELSQLETQKSKALMEYENKPRPQNEPQSSVYNYREDKPNEHTQMRFTNDISEYQAHNSLSRIPELHQNVKTARKQTEYDIKNLNNHDYPVSSNADWFTKGAGHVAIETYRRKISHPVTDGESKRNNIHRQNNKMSYEGPYVPFFRRSGSKSYSPSPLYSLQQYREEYGAPGYHNIPKSKIFSTHSQNANNDKHQIWKQTKHTEINNLNSRSRMTNYSRRGKRLRGRKWKKDADKPFHNIPKQSSVLHDPKLVCKALVQLSGGMDQWCEDNCNANFCPSSVCVCGVKDSTYVFNTGQNQGTNHHRGQPNIVSYSVNVRGKTNQKNPFSERKQNSNTKYDKRFPQNSIFQKRSIHKYKNLMDHVPFSRNRHHSTATANPFMVSNHYSAKLPYTYKKQLINYNDPTIAKKPEMHHVVHPSQYVDRKTLNNIILSQNKITKGVKPNVLHSLSTSHLFKANTNNKNHKTNFISKRSNDEDDQQSAHDIKSYFNIWPLPNQRESKRVKIEKTIPVSSNLITAGPFVDSFRPAQTSRHYFIWFNTVAPVKARYASSSSSSSNEDENEMSKRNFEKEDDYDKPGYALKSSSSINHHSQQALPNTLSEIRNNDGESNSFNYGFDASDNYVTSRPFSCKAIGPYKGLSHFDQWCLSACVNAMCPLLMCKCL